MVSVGTRSVSSRHTRESLTWLLTTSIPVSLFVIFAASHVNNWRQTGRFTGAVLAAQESVFVVLFIARRRPHDSSHEPVHWLAAAGGSFIVLLLRPSGAASRLAGDLGLVLQVVGACASIVCLTGLGRSFGIVAANRGLKVGGPYRIVRHPIYSSYLIGWAGYVLASPTWRNVIVLATSVLFQLWRISSEEQVLSRDVAYAPYRERVPYRLLPGVY